MVKLLKEGKMRMEENIKNLMIATAKGAVSVLPGGGLLAEYIGLVQSTIVEKRMADWMEKVEEMLKRFSQSIDELAQREDFYTCLQVATTGAMRAYEEEKRILFSNALYHSAVDTNIATDKKIFYMELLNSYTLSHIRILQYFSEDHFNSEDRVKRQGDMTIREVGGTETPMVGILEHLPEFQADPDIVKHITGQLISDNLLGIIDFSTPVSKERARKKHITPYGKAFLDFIKNAPYE